MPETPNNLPPLTGLKMARWAAALLLVMTLGTGCDPVVNFYGSFFPAWIVCLTAGVFFCALLRWIFAVTRIEPHLGPLTLVYPALAFLLSAVIWLIFFNS